MLTHRLIKLNTLLYGMNFIRNHAKTDESMHTHLTDALF
jgi:hypothetical protein